MRDMKLNRNSGFTLMEVAVVLFIVGILAAILTPLVNRYIDEARITRANQEAQTIADGILNFNKDTGKWPIFTTGVNITTSTVIYQVLSGPGTLPTCSTACGSTEWGGSTDTISNQLEFNKPGGTANAYTTSGKFAWRGPYVTNIGSDPWGDAYIVNSGALAFGLNQAGFVLSAGPDNKVQTAFTQNIGSGSAAFVVGGDDIVARIR
jgi:prepilin-type N-terminal cleavage/methylation domain-containing protein